MSNKKQLEVHDLKIYFYQKKSFFSKEKKTTKAVDGISFTLLVGQTTGIIGESGSGKSTLAASLVGNHLITAGRIQFHFDRQSYLIEKGCRFDWQPLRSKVQLIYQDFYNSLNPRQTIFDIISKALLGNQSRIQNNKIIEAKVVALLEKVGLSTECLYRYPHAFSGGQRQRINIARVLALKPQLLICDEIISALDVRVQKQILDLLKKIKREEGISILFISHDLAVVKEFCDNTIVMYRGKIVEQGSTQKLLEHPKEEYTKDLLSSIPSIDSAKRLRKKN